MGQEGNYPYINMKKQKTEMTKNLTAYLPPLPLPAFGFQK